MKSKDLTLYHYWRSSCSWRVRWCMGVKGLEPKYVAVDLLKGEQRSPDYLKKNPAGHVPCLEVDGVYYQDSMAILEWLEEAFPKPSILPKLPVDKMYVRSLAYIISSGTQPLQNLELQRYHSDDPAKQKAYAAHWIHNGLAAYEGMLRNHKKHIGKCSFGDSVTMADLCLIPQCYNAIRFDVSLDSFPLIKKINDFCLATKECQVASPDQFQPK